MTRLVHICLIAALVLGAAAACSKEQPAGPAPEGGRQISLMALDAAKAPSKAFADSPVLPRTYTIHASAYFHSDSRTVPSGDFLVDQTFRSRDTFWISDPARYWPLGGTLEFLAVAVDDALMPLSEMGALNWDRSKVTSSVTVDIPDMVRYPSEVLFASVAPVSSSSGPVAMEFHRSQTLLEFNFVSDVEDVVRLEGISIPEIHLQGRLKVSNLDTLGARWFFAYSRSEDVVLEGSDNCTLGSLGRTFSIILPEQPQQTIDLTFRQRGSTASSWDDAFLFPLSIPGSGIWEMGRKYIFNFSIGTVGINVTPVVEDWLAEDAGSHII